MATQIVCTIRKIFIIYSLKRDIYYKQLSNKYKTFYVNKIAQE